MATNFQSTVRAEQTVAVPGTLVEAAGTYKYLRKGIAEDNTVQYGKFVQNGTTAPYYKGLAANGTAVGIALFDTFNSGATTPSMMVPAKQSIRVVENGVVAIELLSSTSIVAGGTIVAVTTATGVVSIVDAVSTGVVDTGWRVVQMPTGALPAIAFIKK